MAVILAALCLLLSGCQWLPMETETADAPEMGEKPSSDPAPFAPQYSDYAERGMTATVSGNNARVPLMGMLNNLYEGQAAEVYGVLNTAAFAGSFLSEPEAATPYVEVTFRPYSDQNGEIYRVYDSDLVVIRHPAAGKQVCTAATGTYERVIAHLTAVHKEQNALFTLEQKEDGRTAYTLYRQGKKDRTKDTDTTLAVMDVVKQGVVRVTDPEGTYFYDTATGRTTETYQGLTDLYGDTLAVADRQGVKLYTLFHTHHKARVWVALADEESDLPVQGMGFSENGKQLHVVCVVGEASYDRTFTVKKLVEDKTCYILGDWEAGGGYVTEDRAQSVGYKALKKLRHKEAELGYTLSAQPLYQYDLDGVIYLLTELGHWTGSGSDRTYAVDAHLMVRLDLAAGYLATPGEDELRWDMDKDWFQQ